MLKSLVRSCHKNLNICFKGHKNKSLSYNTINRYSNFFSFKPDDNKAKEDEEDIQNLKNISYIIKQVKENNKKLPLILPEKEEKDKDKLTVVLEMDEVLLYAFYPDEHEGYLQAPLRCTLTIIDLI